MPRPPRIDPPGARHHVMNRGARHETLFHDDATCALFLGILSELPSQFDVRIHGYALMPNHYHLLLDCPRGNLSRAMRHLGARFTVLLNRKHAGWDGPVFRGRFKNRVVEDDAYWMHLLAYIHMNPVRGRLVVKVDQSRWTSHAAYIGAERVPEWLVVDELLEHFGSVEAYRSHLRDVQERRDVAPDDFEPSDHAAPRKTARVPRPRVLERPTAEQALAQVTDVTGIARRALGETRRGQRGNREKWLAAWWLARTTGLTHREIAEVIKANTSMVSRWVTAVKRAKAGSQLRQWTSTLLATRA